MARPRRGSYWLLFGGIAAAFFVWLVASERPRSPGTVRTVPTNRPAAQVPRALPTGEDSGGSPLPVRESAPVPPTPTHVASVPNQEMRTPSVSTSKSKTALVSAALAARQRALDLRGNLLPLLPYAPVREAVNAADRSIMSGSSSLDKGRPTDAIALFKEAYVRLETGRAVGAALLEAKQSVETTAVGIASLRNKVLAEGARRYAEPAFSQAREQERDADEAYRNLDFAGAAASYSLAAKGYETVLSQANEAREAAHRKSLEEEATRARQQEDQRRKQEERVKEQALLADNQRASAKGKIRKVKLDIANDRDRNSEGGLMLSVDFDISGMSGVEASLIAFFSAQQGKTYEPLSGMYGTQRGPLAVWENFVPQLNDAKYQGFQLFLPFSRFTLPKGNSNVRADVFLRTGSSGSSVRDLDSRSARISLVQK
jgi:hypothetical protein